MNLLVLMPSFPSPTWGAGTRNYHLLKALSRQHTISLLCLLDSKEMYLHDPSPLSSFVQSATFIARPAPLHKRLQQLTFIARSKSYSLEINHSAKMQAALDTLLASQRFDAILFESALLAGYRLPQDIKVIIDQHNIEHELLQRTYERERSPLRKWYNRFESRLVKQAEIARCRTADIILVTSERERLALQKLIAAPHPGQIIEVIPNGVDIDTFSNNDAVQEIPGRIVFTGAMDYYPNIHAVLTFAQQCWPRIWAQLPGATWHIVGRNPPPEVRQLAQLPGITVTGTIPDTRPLLAQAALAIVPLYIGSGTRLKILEAFAMRKAVVSTSLGCEGLEVEPGTHLVIEDQPASFAQAIIGLLHNQPKRTALGTAGRTLVETRYSWHMIGLRLLHILEEKESVPAC